MDSRWTGPSAQESRPRPRAVASSAPRGSRYLMWRSRLSRAHEAAWVGAWFAGGGIALAMGHLGGGIAGMAGGCVFAALSAAGRHRQARVAVKAIDPCPCGSGAPYGACHGSPASSQLPGSRAAGWVESANFAATGMLYLEIGPEREDGLGGLLRGDRCRDAGRHRTSRTGFQPGTTIRRPRWIVPARGDSRRILLAHRCLCRAGNAPVGHSPMSSEPLCPESATPGIPWRPLPGGR
jgi:hypothetical protein